MTSPSVFYIKDSISPFKKYFPRRLESIKSNPQYLIELASRRLLAGKLSRAKHYIAEERPTTYLNKGLRYKDLTKMVAKNKCFQKEDTWFTILTFVVKTVAQVLNLTKFPQPGTRFSSTFSQKGIALKNC